MKNMLTVCCISLDRHALWFLNGTQAVPGNTYRARSILRWKKKVFLPPSWSRIMNALFSTDGLSRTDCRPLFPENFTSWSAGMIERDGTEMKRGAAMLRLLLPLRAASPISGPGRAVSHLKGDNAISPHTRVWIRCNFSERGREIEFRSRSERNTERVCLLGGGGWLAALQSRIS